MHTERGRVLLQFLVPYKRALSFSLNFTLYFTLSVTLSFFLAAPLQLPYPPMQLH